MKSSSTDLPFTLICKVKKIYFCVIGLTYSCPKFYDYTSNNYKLNFLSFITYLAIHEVIYETFSFKTMLSESETGQLVVRVLGQKPTRTKAHTAINTIRNHIFIQTEPNLTESNES